MFGRAARAFRTPDVDERVSSGPAFDAFFTPIPGTFNLKTQTSHDIEGGFRIKAGAFQMQSSIYNMDLENEIHFNPVLFYNVNLDPTRRYGSETSASLRVSDTVTLRGGMAYTRAVFREGAFGVGSHPFRAPALPIEEVKDPTGAGDSFAGGFMGYIASQPELNREVIKRALFYGGVMGSFAVERFGTERLQSLTRGEIDARFQVFRELTHLE